jgi:DNA polymerase III gamma/tau subunit
MHAFLYIGQSEPERTRVIENALNTLGIASYDRIVLKATDKPSIGVSEARIFMHQLQLAPQSPNGTAAIIPEADSLTTEAQQALLKTLEEPPPHVRLYFGAPSETSLLPTIVSRCQTYTVQTDTEHSDEANISRYKDAIHELVASSPGKRIAYIQSIGKTKDDAKVWIDNAIMACHSEICTKDTMHTNAPANTQIIALLHALLDAKRLTANNINPFQLLEHAFLTL